MIDVHTHTLPGIDDGSRSVEESLAMLADLAEQGVTTVAATPHFYATRWRPEEFFARRRHAAEKLTAALTGREPRLLLGAEVLFFEGISRIDGLEAFCIGETPLLLLEMPFQPWSGRWVREVLEIAGRSDVTVLLAHVDRYLRYTDAATLARLRADGVLMQANTDFFLHFATRRRAMAMLEKDEIHFLGTDCHNTTSRAPRMAAAQALIRRKFGRDGVERLEGWQRRYF